MCSDNRAYGNPKEAIGSGKGEFDVLQQLECECPTTATKPHREAKDHMRVHEGARRLPHAHEHHGALMACPDQPRGRHVHGRGNVMRDEEPVRLGQDRPSEVGVPILVEEEDEGVVDHVARAQLKERVGRVAPPAGRFVHPCRRRVRLREKARRHAGDDAKGVNYGRQGSGRLARHVPPPALLGVGGLAGPAEVQQETKEGEAQGIKCNRTDEDDRDIEILGPWKYTFRYGSTGMNPRPEYQRSPRGVVSIVALFIQDTGTRAHLLDSALSLLSVSAVLSLWLVRPKA
mmetsp:Transcript_56404/g.168820  ORF Transcript_56404/g.168820 Transcript_56404/m.168820 type:complete len:288 (-) Transcript_56404:133-996(-)